MRVEKFSQYIFKYNIKLFFKESLREINQLHYLSIILFFAGFLLNFLIELVLSPFSDFGLSMPFGLLRSLVLRKEKLKVREGIIFQ